MMQTPCRIVLLVLSFTLPAAQASLGHPKTG